ncbi:adenine-specific methyltransferase EcoRI family protein [uncultured Anaerococcus sp.]|uniref:adenine-specific methyltransferase EcoRI family protein n=1 Tax=uncultured Anaerococcus sp. TaxID=293428 RepID=UPI002636D0DF|nr:adenine-specific methyltransferase EcoRI family protein [uncultured Anaerococcus sp.]
MAENNNSRLANAKKVKNDEFYTRLTDIEQELRYYRKHFKGKTVFCNCDDPFESNFFKYFVLNFNRLGLKKLIATCYATSPIANQQLSLFDVLGGDEANKGKPYKAVVTKIYDATGDGGIDMLDVAELFKIGENQLTELAGDGDFRSDECIELLKESDIVVTNPPFSLFREYVTILMDYEKQFVIMGNKNAITYKEFFPLLKSNKVWVGATSLNGGRWMIMPGNVEIQSKKTKLDTNGDIILNVAGVCWFTNLDIKKRHEDLILIKRYNAEEYPKYDNYDAIEVSKVKDIPYDYEGIMGVPITFMDKYSPYQFEVYGATESEGKGFSNGLWHEDSGVSQPLVDEKRKYKRIFIKNLHPEPRNED